MICLLVLIVIVIEDNVSCLIIKLRKGNFTFGVYLKDVFGFAEYKEKATNGLGYKLTLTRNSDNAVLNKGNAINNVKSKLML